MSRIPFWSSMSYFRLTLQHASLLMCVVVSQLFNRYRVFLRLQKTAISTPTLIQINGKLLLFLITLKQSIYFLSFCYKCSNVKTWFRRAVLFMMLGQFQNCQIVPQTILSQVINRFSFPPTVSQSTLFKAHLQTHGRVLRILLLFSDTLEMMFPCCSVSISNDYST